MARSDAWTRTTALLPSRTRLNPRHPEKNEYHMGWKEDGMYQVLKQVEDAVGRPIANGREIIVFGSGSPEGYKAPGEKIEAHHDQQLYSLGVWIVTHRGPTSEVGTLPSKSYPLYVYK